MASPGISALPGRNMDCPSGNGWNDMDQYPFNAE